MGRCWQHGQAHDNLMTGSVIPRSGVSGRYLSVCVCHTSTSNCGSVCCGCGKARLLHSCRYRRDYTEVHSPCVACFVGGVPDTGPQVQWLHPQATAAHRRLPDAPPARRAPRRRGRSAPDTLPAAPAAARAPPSAPPALQPWLRDRPPASPSTPPTAARSGLVLQGIPSDSEAWCGQHTSLLRGIRAGSVPARITFAC
jgi:hypothetical protein